MKITHYMTVDLGTGPITLIDIHHETDHVMLRITHRAPFGRISEVSPEATKSYIATITGAKMSDTVLPEHEEMLDKDIGQWVSARGEQVHRLRWIDGKHGRILATREDLEQYDAANAGMTSMPKPRRSTRIML